MELFLQNEEFEDGKIVKALSITGVFKSVLDIIQSKPVLKPILNIS
jgi:hypothetical protein